MTRRCSPTFLFLAIVSLGAPAVAPAATFQVPRLPGSSVSPDTVAAVRSVQPVGDGVLYASGRPVGGATPTTVWLAVPGAARRALAVIPHVQGASSDEVTVRASSTRMAVAHAATVCTDPIEACKYGGDMILRDEVLAGPLGGPLAPISPCQAGEACAVSSSCGTEGSRLTIALGGDLLAINDRCAHAAEVVNLATGETRRLVDTAVLAVAGGFLAASEPAPGAPPFSSAMTLVVRDAATGAEVYRPGLPATNFAGPPHFALLPDGTLVYDSPVTGVALAVASPTAPAGRVLRAAGPEQIIVGAGPAGVLSDSLGEGLKLVPLDGGPPTALPPVTPLSATSDGRTIVLTQGFCVTTTITSWRLGDPPPALVDDHCPTPLPSAAAVTLPRDRRLHVTLACPAVPRGGCAATVQLAAIGRAQRRGGHAAPPRAHSLGGVQVALDPGTRGPAEIRVTPTGARWVRQHRAIRLRIEVQTRFLGQLPRGDDGHVSGTVALVSTG